MREVRETAEQLNKNEPSPARSFRFNLCDRAGRVGESERVRERERERERELPK